MAIPVSNQDASMRPELSANVVFNDPPNSTQRVSNELTGNDTDAKTMAFVAEVSERVADAKAFLNSILRTPKGIPVALKEIEEALDCIRNYNKKQVVVTHDQLLNSAISAEHIEPGLSQILDSATELNSKIETLRRRYVEVDVQTEKLLRTQRNTQAVIQQIQRAKIVTNALRDLECRLQNLLSNSETDLDRKNTDRNFTGISASDENHQTGKLPLRVLLDQAADRIPQIDRQTLAQMCSVVSKANKATTKSFEIPFLKEDLLACQNFASKCSQFAFELVFEGLGFSSTGILNPPDIAVLSDAISILSSWCQDSSSNGYPDSNINNISENEIQNIDADERQNFTISSADMFSHFTDAALAVLQISSAEKQEAETSSRNNKNRTNTTVKVLMNKWNGFLPNSVLFSTLTMMSTLKQLIDRAFKFVKTRQSMTYQAERLVFEDQNFLKSFWSQLTTAVVRKLNDMVVNLGALELINLSSVLVEAETDFKQFSNFESSDFGFSQDHRRVHPSVSLNSNYILDLNLVSKTFIETHKTILVASLESEISNLLKLSFPLCASHVLSFCDLSLPPSILDSQLQQVFDPSSVSNKYDAEFRKPKSSAEGPDTSLLGRNLPSKTDLAMLVKTIRPFQSSEFPSAFRVINNIATNGFLICCVCVLQMTPSWNISIGTAESRDLRTMDPQLVFRLELLSALDFFIESECVRLTEDPHRNLPFPLTIRESITNPVLSHTHTVLVTQTLELKELLLPSNDSTLAIGKIRHSLRALQILAGSLVTGVLGRALRTSVYLRGRVNGLMECVCNLLWFYVIVCEDRIGNSNFDSNVKNELFAMLCSIRDLYEDSNNNNNHNNNKINSNQTGGLIFGSSSSKDEWLRQIRNLWTHNFSSLLSDETDEPVAQFISSRMDPDLLSFGLLQRIDPECLPNIPELKNSLSTQISDCFADSESLSHVVRLVNLSWLQLTQDSQFDSFCPANNINGTSSLVESSKGIKQTASLDVCRRSVDSLLTTVKEMRNAVVGKGIAEIDSGVQINPQSRCVIQILKSIQDRENKMAQGRANIK